MHSVELEARLLWERSPLESPYFSRSPSRPSQLLCASAIFSPLLDVDPCAIVSSFHQCLPFLSFFHSLCLSVEFCRSHCSPIFIFQPFLTQRRCLWWTQMHVEAALSYSSRLLDKGRATAAGTDRVTSFSWYQTALCHPQAATFCFHGLN